LSQDNRELVKVLQSLNSNIEILTKVVALSIRKDSLFDGKETKQEQVEKLEPLQLPDRIVALVIGSTPDSVKSLRSQRKAKLKKPPQSELERKESEDAK
jgi:hypothetical protein